MEAPRLEYETKCRRCGSFETWFYSTVDNISWISFVMGFINPLLDGPKQYHCEKCKKHTVQDIVSYTPSDPSFKQYYTEKTHKRDIEKH